MAQRKRTRPGAAAATRPVGDTDDLATLRVMVAEFQERDCERQDELQRLAALMQQLTQASSIESILSNGFETVTGLLAPLEYLGSLVPYREPLEEASGQQLALVLNAMARPDWSGRISIPLPNQPTVPIGAVPPPSYQGSFGS